MAEELKVGVGEFSRAMAQLSVQIAAVAATCTETARTTSATLVQATRTNGRVDSLEERMDLVEKACQEGRTGAVTQRELYVALASMGGTAGLIVAAIKWLPALAAAARVAP